MHVNRRESCLRWPQKWKGCPHSFSSINVNLGEKQLVAVVILSRPVGHQLLDVGQVADEAWQREQEVSRVWGRFQTFIKIFLCVATDAQQNTSLSKEHSAFVFLFHASVQLDFISVAAGGAREGFFFFIFFRSTTFNLPSNLWDCCCQAVLTCTAWC